jgi:hypothetical protein
MSDTERDYQVGPGKPPLHTRFKKGQSGNPRGRHAKNLPALLVEALNQPVAVTENGRRRQVTKREAVIAQLVDKSAAADLRATKMLLDILKDIEKEVGTAPTLAAVALANKMARIAWKLMVTGESYAAKAAPATLAGAA